MDIYDGAEWTAADLEDFNGELEHGRAIVEAAEFLCHSGSIDDVESSRAGT